MKMFLPAKKIMGQSFTSHLDDIKGDFMKEAHILKELIEISHVELLDKLKHLNEILAVASEGERTRLEFKIKSSTDASFLWKQTIRIICMRHFEASNNIEIYKLLNLRQFLIGYKRILYHMNYKQDTGVLQGAEGQDSGDLAKHFSASMILDKITSDANDLEDCIICMERRPEVTLPCAHAYCLFCIEQWNVSNKTCPVCRAEVENTDESWVTPDIPEPSEINAEVQKALTELTLNLPDESD